MAKHELFVELDLDGVQIRRKGVAFKVYQEGEEFGQLRRSQGSIVRRGRGDKIGRRMGWNRFNNMMQEEARRAEKRPAGARVGVLKRKRGS